MEYNIICKDIVRLIGKWLDYKTLISWYITNHAVLKPKDGDWTWMYEVRKDIVMKMLTKMVKSLNSFISSQQTT